MLNALHQLLRCLIAAVSGTFGALLRAVQGCSSHLSQRRPCSAPHSTHVRRHAMDSKPRSGGLSGEEKRIFMDMVSTARC